MESNLETFVSNYRIRVHINKEIGKHAKSLNISKEELILGIVAYHFSQNNPKLYYLNTLVSMLSYSRNTITKYLDNLKNLGLFKEHAINSNSKNLPVPTPLFTNFVDLMLNKFRITQISCTPVADCKSIKDLDISTLILSQC